MILVWPDRARVDRETRQTSSVTGGKLRSGTTCTGQVAGVRGRVHSLLETGHAIKPRLAARGKVNSRPSSPVMLRVCLQGRENSACRPNFIKGHPGLGETRVNNDITLINTARDKGLKENIAMAANLKNIHLTIVPLRSGLHALITRPFRSRDVCPATPGTHAGPLYMWKEQTLDTSSP